MKKQRGTVIVEIDGKILLTMDNPKKPYLLPGGQVEKGETPFEAAIRELREETGLTAEKAEILFTFESKNYTHTVVHITASGTPKATAEVKKLGCYGDNTIEVMKSSKAIIEKYLKEFN